MLGNGGVDGGSSATAIFPRRGGAAPCVAGVGHAPSALSGGGEIVGGEIVVVEIVGATAKSAESSASASWRELAKSPAIWLFAAVFFLYPGAETAVGGWVGSYASRLGSRGAEMASMMPAFFWSALTVGRAFATAFLHHFSERRVLRAGCAAGAAGIALMLWAPALAGVIAGALITGLSFSTLYPITVARFSERFGVAARSIGSVMFSLAAVGPAVIPWMVGVISHATGSLRAGLLLPLGATVILFLIHLFEW